MLRNLWKSVLLLSSLFAFVLGSHGLYIYFNRVSLLLGFHSPSSLTKLYLSIAVPGPAQPCVQWMTVEGVQSWFIPSLIITVGIVLWRLQSRLVLRLPRWTRKLGL